MPVGLKNKYIKEDYIEQIIDKKCRDCWSNRNIYLWLVNDLNIKTGTAYNYLSIANERIKQDFDKSNEFNFEKACLQIENQIQKCVADGDMDTFYKLRKELNRILGYHKLDITTGGEPITEIKLIRVDNANRD